jgi:hypothetical protein
METATMMDIRGDTKLIDREIRGHGLQYREVYLDGFMDGCLAVEGTTGIFAILQWIDRIVVGDGLCHFLTVIRTKH